MYSDECIVINLKYEADEIIISDVKPWNADCISAKVSILGSKPHGVTINKMDGQITWFHKHPMLRAAHYSKAEEALKELWRLIFEPNESEVPAFEVHVYPRPNPKFNGDYQGRDVVFLTELVFKQLTGRNQQLTYAIRSAGSVAQFFIEQQCTLQKVSGGIPPTWLVRIEYGPNQVIDRATITSTDGQQQVLITKVSPVYRETTTATYKMETRTKVLLHFGLQI